MLKPIISSDLSDLWLSRDARLSASATAAGAALMRGEAEANWPIDAIMSLLNYTSGNPVRVIPAVPDLDPGYHTNLCLLEALKLRGEL